MSEKAVLTLVSGERLELFPPGAAFETDLFHVLERAIADSWIEGRDATGARLRVRARDVSSVKVVDADPIVPSRLWPPPLETKAADDLCGAQNEWFHRCAWPAGHAGPTHSWSGS